MKIAGTIVNKEMNLIGLLVKCKPSEIGVNLKESYIMRPFKLDDAKKLIKSNKISDFKIDKKGNIVGKNNKKLSDLPMFDSRGNFVDKRIQLMKVIEIDNKLAGGQVLFLSNNSSKKLKIEDLVFIYNYCDATNFILKNRDDNYFITGKGEIKKEDIPVEVKEQKKVKQADVVYYPDDYDEDDDYEEDYEEDADYDEEDVEAVGTAVDSGDTNAQYIYNIGGLYLYPKYNKTLGTYIFIPYFDSISSFYDAYSFHKSVRSKINCFICNDKFMSNYFKYVGYRLSNERLAEEKKKCSDDDLILDRVDSWWDNLCVEKDGCENCNCSCDSCEFRCSFIIWDNSPAIYFGEEQFCTEETYSSFLQYYDIVFSKLSKLSKDTKIKSRVYLGSDYIDIWNSYELFTNKFPIFLDKSTNRRDDWYSCNRELDEFLVNNPSKVVAKKANKYGLSTTSIPEVDTIYKNKDGVPLLEYCKPAKGYPLGYFKLLIK